MAKKQTNKRLYTLKEAAVYLGRSVYAMRELVWGHQVPVVQHGRKMWVDIRDLDSYIEKNKSMA